MLLWILAVIAAAAAGLVCLLSGAFQSLTWLWLLPVSFVGTYLGQALVIFLTLCVVEWFIDTSKPQEKDSPLHRFLLNMIATTAMPLLRVRLHLEGLEKLPRGRRFMLVCNHLDIMDPVTLVAVFRKSQLAFISKRENSSLFIVGKYMHKIQCQMINRENDREALKTILKCIQILNEDKASIAVFPEGYTSLDEKLHPFRSGVFKIAQKAKVPIVVCTLQNTQKIFRNAKRLKATDVHLHLLDVLEPADFEGCTTVEIAHRVHDRMAQDLGDENVLHT